MPKLQIILEHDTTIPQKILATWQYKIYLIRIRALTKIISSLLKKNYTVKEERNKHIFEEENDNIVILIKEKKQLEKFLFMDYKKLGKSGYEEFKGIMKDRILRFLNRKAHRYNSNIKDNALRIALGGNDVFGFFLRMGILINYKIIDDNGQNQ